MRTTKTLGRHLKTFTTHKQTTRVPSIETMLVLEGRDVAFITVSHLLIPITLDNS